MPPRCCTPQRKTAFYKKKKGVNVESGQNHASSPPPPIYYAHCSSDMLVQIWEGVSPDRKPQSSQESHVPASLVRRRYTRPIVQLSSISAHRTLADDKVILTCASVAVVSQPALCVCVSVSGGGFACCLDGDESDLCALCRQCGIPFFSLFLQRVRDERRCVLDCSCCPTTLCLPLVSLLYQ